MRVEGAVGPGGSRGGQWGLGWDEMQCNAKVCQDNAIPCTGITRDDKLHLVLLLFTSEQLQDEELQGWRQGWSAV